MACEMRVAEVVLMFRSLRAHVLFLGPQVDLPTLCENVGHRMQLQLRSNPARHDAPHHLAGKLDPNRTIVMVFEG